MLANDSDPDGHALDVISVTQGSDGAVVLNADDTVIYTPNQNFHGSDSFSYTVIDGHGGSDIANVNITVDPVNDAPDAVNDLSTTDQDVPLTIDVLTNDTDVDDDPLSVLSVTDGSNGAATTDGTTVNYTPNSGYHGTDIFSYTVSDGKGGFDTAQVEVTINEPVVAPPVDKGIVTNVDNTHWETVNLSNTYTNMVVIATPNYDKTQVPLVTRKDHPTSVLFLEIRYSNCK